MLGEALEEVVDEPRGVARDEHVAAGARRLDHRLEELAHHGVRAARRRVRQGRQHQAVRVAERGLKK